jgi:FAD/FMN-containing dehydrogenase
MIGNNSCGATAQRTGKVVDNLARLEVLLYDGTRFWCGETTDDEYTAIERRGNRQRPSTDNCDASAIDMRTRFATAIQTSPAAYPVTTSTRCCRRNTSTLPVR